LYSLGNFGFLTRTHLQKMHNLKSNRNTSRVMKDLEEFTIMKRHYLRNGEAVYYLNQKGRELTGIEKEWRWSENIEHHLMKNDLYLFFDQPKKWKLEEKVTFRVGSGLQFKEYVLIPDITFVKDEKYHFIEVDYTQSMKENKKKINLYKELTLLMKKQFRYKPIVVFYTTTEHRKKMLKKWCEEKQLEYIILTKEDLR
jgi:Replication-relaxation